MTGMISGCADKNNDNTIERSTVGVIRWDSNGDNLVAPVGDNEMYYVMSKEARYLSYPQFFRRLPFYAEVSERGMALYRQWIDEGCQITAPNPSTLPWEQYSQTAEAQFDPDLKINGAMQSVIDQEIAYTVEAGIDYWAYVFYRNFEEDWGGCYQMAAQRNLFINNPNKRGLKWCPILYTGDGDSHYTIEEENWIIEQMKSDDFMTVQGGRPLVYVSVGGGTNRRNTQAMVRSIRNKAEAIGKNPYIAVIDWSWDWDPGHPSLQYVADMEAEAISWYATTGPLTNAGGNKYTGTFEELHNEQKESWADPFKNMRNPSELKAGVDIQIIPSVTVGVDTRPRIRKDLVPPFGEEPYWGNLEPDATGAEIEEAIFDALKFNYDNYHTDSPNSILIYCWNEFTEGGLSVCPHFDPDNPGTPNTMVIDAIGAAVKRAEREFDWKSWTPGSPIQTSNPTVTLRTAASSPISGPIIVDIEFSQPVFEFTVDDITIIGGIITEFSGEDESYRIIVEPDFTDERSIRIELERGAAVNNAGMDSVFSNIIRLNKQPLRITVTFDTNGGRVSERYPQQAIFIGSKVDEAPAPLPPSPDKRFAGWYTSMDFTKKWDFENDTVAGDMVLYAKWE